MRAAVLLLMLTGCTALGYQSTSVSVDRFELWQLDRTFNRLYGQGEVIFRRGCADGGTMPQDVCAYAQQVAAQLAALDSRVIETMRQTGTLDLETLTKGVGLAVELLARLGVKAVL